MMGDVAKGIKAFRKGLADEDQPASPTPPAPVAQVTADPVVTRAETTDTSRQP
jgi:sec-independent protein translocase protein TatA